MTSDYDYRSHQSSQRRESDVSDLLQGCTGVAVTRHSSPLSPPYLHIVIRSQNGRTNTLGGKHVHRE